MKRCLMLICCLVSVTFSYAVPSMPADDYCPGVAAIQAQGISEDQLVEGKFGLYGVRVVSEFDKETVWTFLMGPIPGLNKQQATDNANQMLSLLEQPSIELFACLYLPFSDAGLNAVAIEGDIQGYKTLR